MDQIGCPSCGESFRIDDSYRGRSFECHCGQIVNVPAASPGAVPLPPPPPPPPHGYAAPPPRPSGDGTTALVLGILGIVLCPLCAPFAWASGGRVRREAMARGFPPDGMAVAGWVMGIIGTIIMVFYVLVGVIWIIMVATMASSATMH